MLFMSYPWIGTTLMPAVTLAEELGIQPRIAETVSLGGAGPAGIGRFRAAAAVEAGACKVAVAASSSTRASGIGREAELSRLWRMLRIVTPRFHSALNIPVLYALAAERHMDRFSTTPEQLATVAMVQRAYAASTPGATKRERITVDDVIASKVVASPLHLLDCCLVTDYSGAVVLTTSSVGCDPPLEGVRVLGWGEAHSPVSVTRRRDLEAPDAARRSAAEAFAQAGVSPNEIELAEIYDSFTITVLLSLEALGFCGLGEAGPFVESGALAPNGRLPTNTYGGMLSFGTGGVYHVTEAVAQLRGERSGARRPSTALVTGVGGILSTFVTLVLAREGAL